MYWNFDLQKNNDSIIHVHVFHGHFHNCQSWSFITVYGQILIQWIRVILSDDKMTKYIQKKAFFLFVIDLIAQTKENYRMRRKLEICKTFFYVTFYIHV